MSRYSRNAILNKFSFLDRREKLDVDMLVLRHAKPTQISIVSTVIRCLSARLENLEYWHELGDHRRYSHREYLDVELALNCEKQLLSDILADRIGTQRFRENFSKLGIAA